MVKRVERRSRGGLRAVKGSGDLDVSGAQSGDLTRSGEFADPTLNDPRETILLTADTMAGKSYTYMRMAKMAFEDEDNWKIDEDKKTYIGPKFFVFDFDDTLPTFMNAGYEFEMLYSGIGGNVYPFYCPTWEKSLATLNTIRRDSKRGDWIIFDVIARLYEQAQNLIGRKVGKDVDETIVRNLTAEKARGFGAFDPGEWNAVTRTFMSVYDRCFRTTECHILTLSHLRDVVSVRAKRETLVMFHQLGLEPITPPKVPGMQNTIVFLWNVRTVERNEKRKDIGGKTIRKMTVIKDRGESYYYTEIFDRDFYEILEAERASGKHHPVNVTDADEVAAVEADGEGLLDGSGEDEDPTSDESSIEEAPKGSPKGRRTRTGTRKVGRESS